MKPLADRWGYATTPGFEGWEPARVAAALSALGYRFVEWTPDFCTATGDIGRSVKSLAEASRNAGIAISQIMAMADYVTGDDAQRDGRVGFTLDIIDAAAASGIGMVGIYAGPDSWDASAPHLFEDIAAGEAWGRLFAALDRLIPHAESRNVILAFKPCIGTLANDYHATLPVIARYGASKAFAINYDPSHFTLHGNDVPWTIAQLGSSIRHVQLKDVFGIPGTEGQHFFFPLLGDGKVDWRGFIGAIDSIGYDGPLIALFEAFGLHRQLLGGDPLAAGRVTMERLRLLKTITGAGAAR